MNISNPPDLPQIDRMDSRLATYLRQVTTWAAKQLRRPLDPEQAVDHIFLLSPAGKIYKITVSDMGTIVTTLTAPGGS